MSTVFEGLSPYRLSFAEFTSSVFQGVSGDERCGVLRKITFLRQSFISRNASGWVMA